MKVATWNVNSIRTRYERLALWLARASPDIVCLQETKVTDEDFPAADLEALGYHTAFWGQAAYNGVALLSRYPLTDVVCGLQDGLDDTQARLITARAGDLAVASVYVPNGGKVLTDAYDFKIEWMRRFRMMLDRRFSQTTPLVVCGDFNVVPEPRDASHWPAWTGTVLGAAEIRRLFEEILRFGLVDSFRLHQPDPGYWSWWDYRGRGYEKDEGVRIDFVLPNAPLVEHVERVWIDKEERDPGRHESKPSDHAPVVCELSIDDRGWLPAPSPPTST